MGKTSKRRPTLVNRDENDVRWALAQGEIDWPEFDRAMKKLERQGKLLRKR